MIAFVLRRLLQGIAVMLVVGLIAFSLFNFVGDPVALMLPPEATAADRSAMRQTLGLDRPFYVQFATFIGNALHGNFGISLRLGRPVSTLLVERLPATLELAAAAMVMAIGIGIPLGLLAGYFGGWMCPCSSSRVPSRVRSNRAASHRLSSAAARFSASG